MLRIWDFCYHLLFVGWGSAWDADMQTYKENIEMSIIRSLYFVSEEWIIWKAETGRLNVHTNIKKVWYENCMMRWIDFIT